MKFSAATGRTDNMFSGKIVRSDPLCSPTPILMEGETCSLTTVVFDANRRARRTRLCTSLVNRGSMESDWTGSDEWCVVSHPRTTTGTSLLARLT